MTIFLNKAVKRKEFKYINKVNDENKHTRVMIFLIKVVYLYTLAVSPSLGGSRQHKRNNKVVREEYKYINKVNENNE